jgi:hypothetical protein
MGFFASLLLGQTVGSSLMTNDYFWWLIGIIFSTSVLGIYYSFKMSYVPSLGSKVQFYKNPFKDSWLMYRSVAAEKSIRLNLHAIAWSGVFAGIYTTQLPILVLYYYGGNGHVFSVILILFLIGIALGSVICAKLSKGQIVKSYVPFGVLGASFCLLILLLSNYNLSTHVANLYEFIASLRGILVFTICLFSGMFFGFYILTCNTDIQLSASDQSRSQVIAAANMLAAVYLMVGSLISVVLSLFMSVWWLLFMLVLLNIVFAYYYHRQTQRL